MRSLGPHAQEGVGRTKLYSLGKVQVLDTVMFGVDLRNTPFLFASCAKPSGSTRLKRKPTADPYKDGQNAAAVPEISLMLMKGRTKCR